MQYSLRDICNKAIDFANSLLSKDGNFPKIAATKFAEDFEKIVNRAVSLGAVIPPHIMNVVCALPLLATICKKSKGRKLFAQILTLATKLLLMVEGLQSDIDRLERENEDLARLILKVMEEKSEPFDTVHQSEEITVELSDLMAFLQRSNLSDYMKLSISTFLSDFCDTGMYV
jgi:hypothetical protein